MEEVSEEELKATLHSFRKDKIPGPNGWTIEFFLEAYETISPDLLHLVEESRVNGHVHPPLKTTFLALIPKKRQPGQPGGFQAYIPLQYHLQSDRKSYCSMSQEGPLKNHFT